MNAPSRADQRESVHPSDRLRQGVDIGVLIAEIAAFYQLGSVVSYSEITVGYEDCNVIIETTTGKYVTKLFARSRTKDEVDRYVLIMQKTEAAGVRHASLLRGRDGKYVFCSNGTFATTSKFISGKTFYELDRAPNHQELQDILVQITKMNAVDCRPSYVAGQWAVPNIRTLFEQTKRYISHSDAELAEHCMHRYEAIDTSVLPHGFVHGDLRKTNILLGDDGKVYLLDFFLTNWLPRVQELAVIAASLLHEPTRTTPLEEICAQLASMYGGLTESEMVCLPDYVRAAITMEFLGGFYEKHVKHIDNEENDYWLRAGAEAWAEYIRPTSASACPADPA